MPEIPPEVAQRIAAGAYAEAAKELRRLGELERAQALYEKVWDFAAAAEVAVERGDRPELLRLLIEAKDFARAAHVGLEIQRSAAPEQERAAAIYERHRMWSDAAGLWEAVGKREKARELFRKAQLPLEVARLDEALGRTREAGMVYEQFLVEEPDSPETPRAAAALARILGGFGRHEEATLYLQRALGRIDPRRRPRKEARTERGANRPEPGEGARPPSDMVGGEAARQKVQRELLERLVVELAALGYRDAARAAYDELAAGGDDTARPPVEEFLAAAMRAARLATHSDGKTERGSGDAPDDNHLIGGRYQVERLLGSGGMGRVYLARDLLAARPVAVKVVAPPVDAAARANFERFLREARVVSALRHPHIVTVTEFHERLGLLAMEYMAGGTLAERLARPLPPTVARTILGQVIAGLEAAHAHGVIHRDIKPGNIFFAAAGEAKLGDFGVAHLQDLGATQTGGFIGTLAYMSPEQITGAPLTFACDVYALGVTTFQMLTGRLPFEGPDFVGQHLGETPPTVSSRRPELGDAFDALVGRMLAKAPSDRFATLDELGRALAALVLSDGTKGTAAAPVDGGPRAASPARKEPGERYLIEAEVGGTRFSTLARGIDQRLGRTVIVERYRAGFLDGEEGARQLVWLRAMARHGGPHLQRVLRIERATGRVIYEAPVGPPPAAVDRAGLARLALGIARALVGPHGEGVAHGAIARALVLEPLAAERGPTLTVAGHGPSVWGSDKTPADDLRDLAALLKRYGSGVAPTGVSWPDLRAVTAWAEALLRV